MQLQPALEPGTTERPARKLGEQIQPYHARQDLGGEKRHAGLQNAFGTRRRVLAGSDVITFPMGGVSCDEYTQLVAETFATATALSTLHEATT